MRSYRVEEELGRKARSRTTPLLVEEAVNHPEASRRSHETREVHAASPRAAFVLCTLVAVAVVVGCASTPTQTETPTPASAPYRVGISDQLLLRIHPEPEIERTVTVRPDGMVSIDLIGDVLAANRTSDEIARVIEARFAEYRVSPRVTVSLEATNSAMVDVLGEVGSPGRYPLIQATRLTNALTLAGGPTTLAANERIRLIRRQSEETTVFYVDFDAIQQGDRRTDFMLQTGDVVVVPPATPVAVGYSIRRALYPVEIVLGVALRGLISALAFTN
jgi:polysaccharide export outer membrane protein